MISQQSFRPEFVFVGGVPRSGTTLVQKVLDLHTEVYGGPELGVMPQLMSAYRHMRQEIAVGKLSVLLDSNTVRDRYREFLEGLYAERLDDPGIRVISEKTPSNLLAFDDLADAFPGSRFVWVVRDPRDVLCSFRSVRERGERKGMDVPYGRSLTEDLGTIERFMAAGEAFREAHADRLHVVHYERLVSAPADTVRALCHSLGLTFEERMLMTGESTDISESIKRAEARYDVYYNTEMFDRGIDASNVGRWRRELDGWSTHAVQVRFGGKHWPSLAPYALDSPDPVRQAVFAGWHLGAELVQAAKRRLPGRGS